MIKTLTTTLVFLFLGLAMCMAQKPDEVIIVKDGTGAVASLKYSPDGKELARITMFGPPMIYQTDGFNKIRSFNMGMRMIAFSPDGKLIATAEGRDGLRIWDSSKKGTPVTLPPTIKYQVFILDEPYKVLFTPSRVDSVRVLWNDFSPDGNIFINTHASGHLSIWNAKTWEKIDEIAFHKGQITAARYTPDSKELIIGFEKGDIFVFDIANKSITDRTHSPGFVTGIDISPDGQQIVSSHQSNTPSGNKALVNSWKFTKNTFQQPLTPLSGYAKAAFSPNGKLLALAGAKIDVYHLPEMNIIQTIALPDMSLMDTKSNPEQITQMPDYAQEKEKYETKRPTSVAEMTFSPDSKNLAVGTSWGTIHIIKITP